jgi:hypothetical protein
MVQNVAYKFPMPYSSWETIKKIVRAYNAAGNQENPTVEEIANLAGLHRPQVSSSNKFLREIGLLQPDQNKLTNIGSAFANGMELGYESMVAEALTQSVQTSVIVSQWVNTLRARGTMTVEQFKGQIITQAGLTAQSPSLIYVKTVLDYLEAATLIRVDGDILRYVGQGQIEPKPSPLNEGEEAEEMPLLASQSKGIQQTGGIPIALGIDRLAYLQLPDRWSNKELPKLLKMIELALGDESE